MKDSRIIMLTMNPALDKSTKVDRVVPGKKLRCQEPQFDAGGGGINVARAVKEMGGDVTALFMAGGWSGDRLTELLDASGTALQQALSKHPYLIKPNLRELGYLVGSEMESDEQIEAAARKLVNDGKCDICVVSMGAGGALWVSGKGIHRFNTPTVRIHSRVGAGDSTVAGIVFALSKGWTERQALALGVAAGAAAVMTPGTELCRREDVDHLYVALQEKDTQRTGKKSSV